ncbi:MAG: GNAT family N-acetyltransferase [Actinobacteria bacterium]|jgi:RimJ/RimL family protein N-acetyltransferase|nr:GNAT family N-acetyltransferase [Actinomycetota bacterium]MDA8186291.1 GNAT family protein [Actinomycetota bacterium]
MERLGEVRRSVTFPPSVGSFRGVQRLTERRSPVTMARSGRFVSLQPVLRQHYPFLYDLATAEGAGARWRFRGAVPREEVFERLLWEGVLTQLVVERRASGDPVGVVCAYGANLVSGTVKVGVALVPTATGRGLGIEAFILFVRYLFNNWRVRKLYLETPEFNCRQIRSMIGRYLHEEGRLRDDEFIRGRLWDTVILAMYPADLDRMQEHLGPFLAKRTRCSDADGEAWPIPQLAGSEDALNARVQGAIRAERS